MDNGKKNLMLMVPMLHQGGFERVCIATARLMQDYYNVYVLIFSSKNINYDITGLNVIDINVPSKKGLLNKVLNVIIRVIKTRKKKRELKIDLSYSFGSSANYVNVLSKRKEKTLTGLRCQTDLEQPRQVKLFCSKSDQVLSCSREIVRQLVDDFNYNKNAYIYNPLDISNIQKMGEETVKDMPFSGEKARVITCMARNDYIKGIWHLVKAFSLVYEKHHDARLLIVGAGNWEEYEKLAEKLGISGKAVFPGVKKNPFAYVAASDIYVCSSNHEGFPNAVLEAMALKKPVISADCKTGPREILLSEKEYERLIEEKPDGSSIDSAIMGKYGILIPDLGQDVDMNPDSITDNERILASEINRLLENSESMEYYSVMAYERALSYSPDKYKKSIHKIFENIMGK